MLPAGLALPGELLAARPNSFRVRTITAGVPLALDDWDRQFQQAAAFLDAARSDFQARGYEVQTLRIATQPLPEYLSDWPSSGGLQLLAELDEFCQQQDMILSIGPIIHSNQYEPKLADWAAELIRSTSRISFTVAIASADTGVPPGRHPIGRRDDCRHRADIRRRGGQFPFRRHRALPARYTVFPGRLAPGRAIFRHRPRDSAAAALGGQIASRERARSAPHRRGHGYCPGAGAIAGRSDCQA